MWPRAIDRSGLPSSGPRLTARGRMVAALGFTLFLLITVLTAWLSVRAGQHAPPVHSAGGEGVARIWTWDGSDYTLLPPVAQGPYSTNADMTYDRQRAGLLVWDHGCGRLVMGFTGGCQAVVNQTWTWDGRGWTAQKASSTPIENGPGTMLYDTRLRQPVYVNGMAQAWAWTGGAWVSLSMPGGPRPAAPGSPLRSTFAAGYDEARGLLVIVLSDRTWTWDGARWTAAGGGIDAGDARPDPHAVFDASARQLIYVGRRFTWTWSGGDWQRHDQPPFGSPALAYDGKTGYTVLVQEDTSDCDKTACRTLTWTWSSSSQSWIPARVANPPLLPLTRSGAYTPPMAFDAARGVLVYLASPN